MNAEEFFRDKLGVHTATAVAQGIPEDSLSKSAAVLLTALKEIAECAGPPTGSKFGTLNKISLIANSAIKAVEGQVQ